MRGMGGQASAAGETHVGRGCVETLLPAICFTIMTAAALAQMIEELPMPDKEAAEEYISMLYARQHPDKVDELDAKYREYVLQGIREGEEDIANGDVLSSAEALKYLEELLNK